MARTKEILCVLFSHCSKERSDRKILKDVKRAIKSLLIKTPLPNCLQWLHHGRWYSSFFDLTPECHPLLGSVRSFVAIEKNGTEASANRDRNARKDLAYAKGTHEPHKRSRALTSAATHAQADSMQLTSYRFVLNSILARADGSACRGKRIGRSNKPRVSESSVCVCVCVRARISEFVRACVRAYVRACVSECTCVRHCVRVCCNAGNTPSHSRKMSRRLQAGTLPESS